MFAVCMRLSRASVSGGFLLLGATPGLANASGGTPNLETRNRMVGTMSKGGGGHFSRATLTCSPNERPAVHKGELHLSIEQSFIASEVDRYLF